MESKPSGEAEVGQNSLLILAMTMSFLYYALDSTYVGIRNISECRLSKFSNGQHQHLWNLLVKSSFRREILNMTYLLQFHPAHKIH